MNSKQAFTLGATTTPHESGGGLRLRSERTSRETKSPLPSSLSRRSRPAPRNPSRGLPLAADLREGKSCQRRRGGLVLPLLASVPACRKRVADASRRLGDWLRVLSARFEVRADVQPAPRTEVPCVPLSCPMPLDFQTYIFHCVVRPVLNEVEVDRQERTRATVTPCRARVGPTTRMALA